MQPVLEPRDDTEVPSPTPQHPEELAVAFGTRPHDVARSGDDLGRHQVVGGESVLAHEPAEPATECQNRDTGRGHHAAGRGEAMEMGLPIDTVPRHASLSAHRATLGIDVDALHQREVEHQPTFADGLPRDAVTVATDAEIEAVRAGESNGVDDVGGPEAASDQGGTADERAVVDAASLVVADVGWREEGAT